VQGIQGLHLKWGIGGPEWCINMGELRLQLNENIILIPECSVSLIHSLTESVAVSPKAYILLYSLFNYITIVSCLLEKVCHKISFQNVQFPIQTE